MLTAKQKKFIRKNARKLTLDELAQQSGIIPEELKEHLKKIWKEDKFTKYTQKSLSVKPVNLSPKDWLKNNWYIILGLILLVLLVYLNGLNAAFVSDDIPGIVKNPDIGNFRKLSLGMDRSAVWFIFCLAHALGGLTPLFYRLPNLLMHMGSTVAVFVLLSILANKKTAIFTSLIFAVHPILIESVTWISGESQSGYAFFFLLSFITYLLSENSRKRYILSIIFFIISFLFSEKAVSLILVFPLYEFTFGSLRKNWKRLIPYLLVGGLALGTAFIKISGRISDLETYNYVEPGVDNLLIKIPIAVTEYLKLMLWPDNLTLYHSELAFSLGGYLFRALFCLGLFITALWAYFKKKFVFFWLSFFVITLLPTLTPFRIASIVAERYVYLGSIGIFAIVGSFFDYLCTKTEFRKVIYSIFAVLIVALSIRTIARNHDWLSEDNLWLADAKTASSSPNVYNNLGDVYGRHKDYQKAIEAFKKAVELKPDYADAYHNLANAQLELARQEKSETYLNEAINNYLLAIKYNPVLWQSYLSLGAIYYDLKEYDKAASFLKKAIEINPGNPNSGQILKILEKIK